MIHSGRARPKILVAHQWRAERGLYGADRVILRILGELLEVADLLVVIESEGEFADAARKLGCHVAVIQMGVLRRKHMTPVGLFKLALATFIGVLRVARLIGKEQVSLVFTSTVSVLASGLAAKLTARPHIWLIQEALVGNSRALAPLVIRISEKIIAVSKASAENIINGGSTHPKIAVAYPGVDTGRFNSEHDTSLRRNLGGENNVLIAHVARIHYWKGQDYFLDALAELKKRSITGFRGLIIGEVYPGYEELRETLKQQVKTLRLDSIVSFLGHRDDVDAIFAAVDITVSPATLPEPFGLVIAEAMASRRPVVATNLGAPNEIIQDGVNGFLVPANEVQIFADRLALLIADKSLRERIGAAARDRIEHTFSSEMFDRQVRQIVESYLPESRPHAVQQPVSPS